MEISINYIVCQGYDYENHLAFAFERANKNCLRNYLRVESDVSAADACQPTLNVTINGPFSAK